MRAELSVNRERDPLPLPCNLLVTTTTQRLTSSASRTLQQHRPRRLGSAVVQVRACVRLWAVHLGIAALRSDRRYKAATPIAHASTALLANLKGTWRQSGARALEIATALSSRPRASANLCKRLLAGAVRLGVAAHHSVWRPKAGGLLRGSATEISQFYIFFKWNYCTSM